MKRTAFKSKVKIIDYSIQLGEPTIPLPKGKKQPIAKSKVEKRSKVPKVKKVKEKLPTIIKLKKQLYTLSHTYIRKRDSKNDYEIAGQCFDCGKWGSGKDFQAGHFLPDGGSGAWLRYHPHNMHGQHSGCNGKFQQETVKIRYTLAMQKKYGEKYIKKLYRSRDLGIDADRQFYNTMIELYKAGIEKDIINYLEDLSTSK